MGVIRQDSRSLASWLLCGTRSPCVALWRARRSVGWRARPRLPDINILLVLVYGRLLSFAAVLRQYRYRRREAVVTSYFGDSRELFVFIRRVLTFEENLFNIT